jgi:hypothetical protein
MSLPLSAGLLSFGVPFRQSRLLNPTRRRSSKQNSSKPTHVKFLKCIRIRSFHGDSDGRILSQIRVSIGDVYDDVYGSLLSDRLGPVRRLKFTFDDALLLAAIAAFMYFKNWWASAFLLLVIAYLIIRYYRQKRSKPSAEDNEFVIDRDKDSDSFSSVELDIGLDYRPKPNHFRIDSGFDTSRSAAIYEYRVDTDGTKPEVQFRLIDNQYEDIGVPRHHDVRDGVVMESDMGKRDEESKFHIVKVEEKIQDLQKEVQWQKMESTWGRGLRYFIISKKLPPPDARRYFRQEMERLKAGESEFFQEAEKLGLERDDESKSLDRLKVSEGKPRPSNEELRNLNVSVEKFGITSLEFSWGPKLRGVLEKLLGDAPS